MLNPVDWKRQIWYTANMQWIVLGDLHGESRFIKKVQVQFPNHQILLMGDLIDSFTVPISGQIQCLDTVLDLIRQGGAVCLFGNHEASYLHPALRASGWTDGMDRHVQLLRNQILAFPRYQYFPQHRTLFSHAGLTKQLWDGNGLSLESLEDTLKKWALDLDSPYYHIGRYRGGYNKVGGLLWCDWNFEFEPVPGLIQVVGHSASFQHSKKLQKVEVRIKRLRKNGDNWNVDCLQKSGDVLEFDDKTGALEPQTLL